MTHRGFFDGYHDAWNSLLDAQNEVIASLVHEFPDKPSLAASAHRVLDAFQRFRAEQLDVYTRILLRIEETEYFLSRVTYDTGFIRADYDAMRQECYRIQKHLGLEREANGDS